MNDFEEAWPLPPTVFELAPGEVHVWQFGLDSLPALLENYHQTLNEAEQNRAARFYFERDRNRFTTGRAILRNILGLYLNENPTSLQFEYGPQGKPGLVLNENGKDRLEFNLAHSHRLALLAVTTNQRLGIDIEYTKGNIAFNELVARFFAPSEVVTFQRLPASQQPEAFYNAWTRKEAYLKACGGGITGGLDRVVVSFIPGQPARIMEIGQDKKEAARWSLAALHPAPDYQAALVVETPVILTLKQWRWPE